MKLGLSTYTYTWQIGVRGYPTPERPLTAIGLLNKTNAMGVDLVQICDNLPLINIGEEELVSIKDTALKLGIGIEVGTRGIERQNLEAYLAIAEYLGSDILRIILEKDGDKVKVEEAVARIKDILPEFIARDICLAIENHERYTVNELRGIIENIDSPYLGICLDTVNSFGALEGPGQVVSSLAPYTVNLHIKDFEIKRLDHQMGFTITGTPAGYGRLDIDVMLEAVKNNGRKANAILELWTPFTGDVEDTILIENTWAEKSIKYLRGKINDRY